MTWRPSINDPVQLAEDRLTGLCQWCGKEGELKRIWGENLCPDCYNLVESDL